MFRERILSSLVTRLTLAVLAVLLLSLGLTTAFFVVQSTNEGRGAVRTFLEQSSLAVIARNRVLTSLLNAPQQHPLQRVNPRTLGLDRVLLTTWDGDRVVADTGGPGTPPATLPITYQGDKPAIGDVHIGGVDYQYLAVPLQVPEELAGGWQYVYQYRNAIFLKQVYTLEQRTLDTIANLALPGVVAVILSALAALVALRAITRPLHEMTLASERMATGDYDQYVTGSDLHDEVGQLARAFNRMAHEVKRVREMQRRFIGNVSHDLRSPLTSIIGFSQVLAESTEISPTERRAAEVIHDEAQRLSRLTMDLLDLSRLEAGQLPLNMQPLDLNELLRGIAARYHTLPNAHGILFSDTLCSGPLPVLADADRLTQIVSNLLDNAFKFSNVGGEVRLRTEQQGDRAVIEVYNSGAGIAPDDLPRVFNRFYRGDHSRSQKKGGSGIGLAIVRELVHAHGGEVTADSEVGRWVTITVSLPLSCGEEPFTKGLHKANTGAKV
ncbi:MAG TPA: HAMP domain-containing sensor histidine kinase [Chloroflexota bacterium]|nr:HAMP domain-containing sensor histidine kinase [Chloroflexota bacterium]